MLQSVQRGLGDALRRQRRTTSPHQNFCLYSLSLRLEPIAIDMTLSNYVDSTGYSV